MPAIACGVDRLANDFLHIHPSSLLFRLLPGWIAYSSLMVGQFFLAGYFGYRLCRDRLGLAEDSSVFCGCAASVYLIPSHILKFEWGWAMLPWSLWALEGLCRRRRTAEAAAAAFAAGALYSCCSSFPMTLPFCLAAAWIWLLLVRRLEASRAAAVLASFTSAALLVQSRAAWAMVANSAGSQRQVWVVSSLEWMPGPETLWSFSVGMILVVAGLLWSRTRDSESRKLTALAGLALFAPGPAGYAVTRLMYAWIPALKGFSIYRFWFLSGTALALAGAKALDGFQPQTRRVLVIAALGLLGLQTLVVKASHLRAWYYEGSYAALYQDPVLHGLASREGAPARAVSVDHGFHPAYLSAYGIESADGYINLYPRRYRDFWTDVVEPYTRDHPNYAAELLNWGCRIYLYLADATVYPDGLPFERLYRLDLLSLANVRFVVSRYPVLSPSLRLIASSGGERNLSHREVVLRKIISNFTGRRTLFLYENPFSLPRAFIAHRLAILPDEQSVRRAVAQASLKDLRDVVFAESSTASALPPRTGAHRSRVEITHYEPDRIDLDLEIDGDGVLFLSNSYSPFWKCAIDGRKVPIFPADGAFWGVKVERGDRRAVFTYAPPHRLD